MRKFLHGELFNKMVAIISFVSKIIAVGIAVVILHAFKYIPALIVFTALAMLLGLFTRQLMPHKYTYVKYMIIVLELVGYALIVGWTVFIHAFIAPLPLILTLPLIGNFIGEKLRKDGKKLTSDNLLVKLFDKIVLSEEMFGIERAAKVVVGVYFIVTLGLSSIWIEVLVMSSFAAIATNEIDIKEYKHKAVKTIYRCTSYLHSRAIQWVLDEYEEEEVLEWKF